MADRRICGDCGKQAPETETGYTLINAKHGWRNTRHKDGSGQYVIEWRCPDCWRASKEKAGESGSSGEVPAAKPASDPPPEDGPGGAFTRAARLLVKRASRSRRGGRSS